MTAAQRRATRQYRERGRKSGLKRLEVQVPGDQVEVIRRAAAILRDRAEDAARLRAHLGFEPDAKEPANAFELFALDEPSSKDAEALWKAAMTQVERDRRNPALNRARDTDL